MAYREYGMWEILRVLEKIHSGESRRSVARTTGRCRKTIGRYVDAAVTLGWVPGVHPPDEALAAEVLAQVRPGPAPGGGVSSAAQLEPLTRQLEAWLAPHGGHKRGLRLTKVHELLKRQGVEVSYGALRRFCLQRPELGRTKSTVRMAEVAPGELAEVDFGRLGKVHDPDTGRERVAHALIVTLVHSRHQYVHVTFSQKLTDVIDGLEDAWEFFGGVPRKVAIDNLKPAVTKADRYEPVFQRTFDEYAKHRGFTIDATLVRHPTGKPHVERQVQYVREGFFRGEQWLDLSHVQREARRWCLEKAGTRIHGTTRKQPAAEFDRVERQALRPLCTSRFDVPLWAEPKVHPDHHVQFQKVLYSVPYQHDGRSTLGQKVTVRGDRRMVRIYLRGQLIKTHATKSAGRSTDYDDYPPHKGAYALRSVDHVVTAANRIGPSTGDFAGELLSGDCPWARLRSGQKLVRMADKYGADRVEAACRRALGFGLINVRRVERIIVQGLDARKEPDLSEPNTVTQMPLRFARPPKTLNHKETDPHGN